MKFIIDTRPRRRPKVVFINIKRIAGATGYDKSHISRVIRRKTNPSLPCLMALADALGLSLDDTTKKLAAGNIRSRRPKEMYGRI